MNTYKELKARDAKKRKEEESEIFKLTERHRLLIYPNGVGKNDIPYKLKLLRLIDEAYGVRNQHDVLDDDNWAERHIAYMNENHKKE
jgi:hypothetical protein